MKESLIQLQKWLRQNFLISEANEITEPSEYEENWHQEIVNEYPEISEKDELQSLEEKYTIDPEEISDYPDDFVVAKKEGFKVLDQAQDLLAGEGGFGRVYRGVYQGKPAVIKITWGEDPEVQNWINLLQVKKEIPPKFYKHLPKIYWLNRGHTSRKLWNGKIISSKYSVIIMEELQKLPFSLEQLFSGIYDKETDRVVYQDTDYLFEVAKRLEHYLKSRHDLAKYNLPESTQLFQTIYHFKPSEYSSEDMHRLSAEISQLIAKQNDPKDWYFFELLKEPIREKLNLFLGDRNSVFPFEQENFIEPEQREGFWKQLPETSSLFQFLNYLQDDLGIIWRDIHAGNIMLGRDGELKLIDLGQYITNRSLKTKKTALRNLQYTLQKIGLLKAAQEVEELADQYEEPWHEEAVQEFGGAPISEQEYLKQVAPADPEDILGQKTYVNTSEANLYLQAANQEGFHLAGSGGQTPLLGGGSYGRVFSGIYQGKPAAAKIVFSEISILDSEIIKWYKILQAVKTLSPNLQQHFPTIYHLNRNQVITQDPRGNTISSDYDIIVMEQLKPLPKELYRVLEDEDFNLQKYDRMKRALKDEDYLYEIATLLVDLIKNEPRFRFDMKKFQPNAPEIMKILLDSKIQVTSPEITAAELAGKINHYLLNKYPFRDKYRNFLLPLLTDNIKGILTGKPHRTYHGAMTPKEYHNYEHYSPLWTYLPEMKDLYQALIQLAQEYNIKWSDLHNDNLMLGQDGHIKVIDVGLFSIS